MKLVTAIIRKDRLNSTLKLLYEQEIRGLSVSKVQGHGGELERVETYRGTRVQMTLTEKIRIEIALSESFVEQTVQAIMTGARTGDVGDGKIWVTPIEKIYRIRTGEEDRAAVTPLDSTAAESNSA